MPPEVASLLATLAADGRARAVVPEPGPEGGWRLVVTPCATWLAAERASRREALALRLQRRWSMAYDTAYHAAGAARAPDFTTWTSSLTRAPIAAGPMQCWLDATLARLRALPHRRVLDLGCGTGLVLAGLAPSCEEYVGLDASEEAIAGLEAWVRTQPSLRHVRLLHGPAHVLEDLPAGGADLVVLNSVAQYFPDLEHLLLVLRAAIRCLAPGGCLWLGDLRAAALLPLHATVVAAARGPASAPAAEVRARAAEVLAAGRELALDPGALPALAPLLPRLSDVRFGLKPMGADPELAAFRFDATLLFDGETPPPAPSVWWHELAPGGGAEPPGRLAARLAARLGMGPEPSEPGACGPKAQDAGALAVLGVPNARLAATQALACRLMPTSPGEVRAAARNGGMPSAAAGVDGLEPEDLAEALASLGIATELRPTPGCPEGRFDVLMYHMGPGGRAASWPAGRPVLVAASDPLCTELTDELRGTFQRVAAEAGVEAVRVYVVPAARSADWAVVAWPP